MKSPLNFKSVGGMLMLLAFLVSSCTSEPNYDPIKLSYDADGVVSDNQAKYVSLDLLSKSLPLMIHGGDGNFAIANSNEELVFVEFDITTRTFVINPKSVGTGTLRIEDTAGNKFILDFRVTYTPPDQPPTNTPSNPPHEYKVSTYAIVVSESMDCVRKAELEARIVSDAPKGLWDFRSTIIQAGVPFTAWWLLTNSKDSEHKEYTTILKGTISDHQKPILFNAQILTWFTMKSDREEFVLYITKPPYYLDDKTIIGGYAFISDVIHRYIDDYPELTKAYELQSYVAIYVMLNNYLYVLD